MDKQHNAKLVNMYRGLQYASARTRDISSRLRKRATIYGITDRLLHRLEMIEHSAARIIMFIKRHDRQSITAVLRRLHWLPVKWRINYKIVVLVFRALHGLAPAYVSTLITPYDPRRALRSTGSALLCVPRHNLERYGRRSFSCAGPVLWN